jgi:hypothetical protein
MSKKLSLINPSELFINNKYVLKNPNINDNNYIIEIPSFLSFINMERNLYMDDELFHKSSFQENKNVLSIIIEQENIDKGRIINRKHKKTDPFLNQKIDCQLLLTLCENNNF